MKSRYPDILTPKMTKGITGFNLCAFLIGLEGWRRGLTLTYYGDINQYSDIRTQGKKLIGRSYSLASKDKIHYFNQSRGDIVSNEAVKVAQSKQKTKSYLKDNNIFVLPSIEFNQSNTSEEITNEAKKMGFPVIIKPTYGSLSKGVILNIQNTSKLTEALSLVRGKMGFKSIILEKYFEGDDIRLYIVNDVVVAALRRLPARVTGDGKSTIKELIDQKNELRQHNPYLAARPIKIDREVHNALKKNNYELNSILEEEKTILVKNKSTMDQGVDLYDITDEIPEHVKQLGRDSLRALPNIIHGSIDMIYDGKEAVILEVNPSANISMHMFPTEGQPRNIGAYLMDFYFPETKGKSNNYSNMYFDYLHIVDVLKQNYTNYIEIKPLPDTPIHAKRYIVSGKVQKVGYRSWIRRKATLRNLHGFAKNMINGDVEIVVASDDLKEVEDFKEKCLKGPKKAKVVEVETYAWEKEIKLGFDIETTKKVLENPLGEKEPQIDLSSYKNKYTILNREYKELEKYCDEVLKQKNKYQEKFYAIENSRIWRMTRLLRKVGVAIKKIVRF